MGYFDCQKPPQYFGILPFKNPIYAFTFEVEWSEKWIGSGLVLVGSKKMEKKSLHTYILFLGHINFLMGYNE
jgi:hypothetical protein